MFVLLISLQNGVTSCGWSHKEKGFYKRRESDIEDLIEKIQIHFHEKTYWDTSIVFITILNFFILVFSVFMAILKFQ